MMDMRTSASALFALCLFMATTPSAHAEMVVIATTAPGIALSETFEAGAELNLPEGAEVTLLSIDGTVLTIRGPGGIVGVDEAEDSGVGLIDALRQIIRKRENTDGLGAIRSSSNKCEGFVELLEMLEAGCEREAALRIGELASTLAPALFMGAQKPGPRPVFGLDEPIDITVQSNFDGYVYCFHEGSDGTTTRIVPLTGKPPRIEANRSASLAGDLGTFGSLVASEPVGVDRLACFASQTDLAGVEPELFAGPPVLGIRKLDGKVRKSFEALSGERSAAAVLELEIVR